MKKLCGAMLTAATLIAGTTVAENKTAANKTVAENNTAANKTVAENKTAQPAAANKTTVKTDVVDPIFDLSIRYVDSYAAIRESEEGKKIAKDLEAKRDELTKEIKALEDQFAAAAKELQAKISTLSESGREREQKNMAKMEREYKVKLGESEEEMKITMQAANERLLREHNDAVYAYAKTNAIDLVFGPGGVVYASEKANCTFDVVKNMDKTYIARTKGGTSSTAIATTTKPVSEQVAAHA
jgi:Skp family chaperone for outer membrane proteins